METAKIRQSGYAIRHTYKEFVARYRFLIKNVKNHVDYRQATTKICNENLSETADFQFGKTKIFLREEHDKILERNRMEIYQKSVLIIQRFFRRIIFKKFLKKHRDAAIVIQKYWRSKGHKQKYVIMRHGFLRLQALIKSRTMSNEFRSLRENIITFQGYCRGFLTRKNLIGKLNEKSGKVAELILLRRKEEHDFKKAGNPQWREQAEANFASRLSNLHKELKIDKDVEEIPTKIETANINIEEDSKIVEDVFGFLNELNSPPSSNRKKEKPSFHVSKLLVYFEEKTKSIKRIPAKLLSRPVAYYEGSDYVEHYRPHEKPIAESYRSLL